MKVDIENQKGHFKKLSIQVPPERVQGVFNEHLERVRRDATLKGFRKGKAPVAMIKATYGDAVQNDVLRDVVDVTLREALKEHALEPVGMPEIEIETVLEGVPLKYSATFENTPPVELKQYTGFKLKKKEEGVDAAEVQKSLENIQRSLANFVDVPAERAAEKGLFALMDYEASEAGARFEAACAQNAMLEIGNESLFEGFEKHIVGMKAGDKKDFSVTFPEPKSEAERIPVSGKTLDFSVTLKSLRERGLPALDDAFAAKVGPFETLEDLKARIEMELKSQKVESDRQEYREELLTWLTAENPVEMAETLLNRQMQHLAMEASMQLSKSGKNQTDIEEWLKKWEPDMHKNAERQVRSSLLLSAIGRKENIQVNEEDVRREITRMAMESRRDVKDVFQDLQKQKLLPALWKQLTEIKTLDWLVEQALM